MDTTLSNITRELQTTVSRLPSIIATEAVNFSKERFVAQNWVDDSTHPWKKRTDKTWLKKRLRSGRAILVDSGRLKRSIRKISVTPTYVVIGTDVPYARAHNDGFRGSVHQHVRQHTRGHKNKVKMATGLYSIKTRRERTRTKTVTTSVSVVHAYDRTINQNLPRRRFIGASPALTQRLNRVVTAEINRAIHKFVR